MSDNKQQKRDDESSGPLCGERLAVARRANDISIIDIAKELHLDAPKVQALEENDFDALGAPVFAKGHLRKYAELVDVPIDDILADYYRLNRAAGAPPVVPTKPRHGRESILGPRLILGALIVALAVIAYWWMTREPSDTTPESETSTRAEPATLAPFTGDPRGGVVQEEAIVLDAPQPAAGNEADTLDISGNEVLPTEGDLAPSGPDLASSAALQPGQVRLDLSFAGDCWTEVSDATGRRLFYDLGNPGRGVVSLTGEAPLRVVLGNSQNVSLSVNGRDFPIPASARSGRLARLTINRQ